MGFLPKVSIIVPVHNEEKVIENKLQDLLDIEYPKDNLEIVVVDDGSTDKTREIVQRFASRGVHMLSLSKREGKIFALNLAFENVSGEIVVTTDADVRTGTSVLKEVIPYFGDSKVGAVSATQELVNMDQNRNTVNEARFQEFYGMLRRTESYIDSVVVLNGEFTAIRNGIIGKIPTNGGVDDVEIPMMIRKKGYRCLVAPEAIFLDFAPEKLAVNWKQKIRRSQGIIISMWRHKDVLFNTKYERFGKIVYPGEFFMNIVCPYAILAALLSGLSLLVLDIYIGSLAIGCILATLGAILLVVRSVPGRPGDQKLNLIRGIPNLIIAQFLLFLGSLRCLTKRQFHKWEKITETRRSA